MMDLKTRQGCDENRQEYPTVHTPKIQPSRRTLSEFNSGLVHNSGLPAIDRRPAAEMSASVSWSDKSVLRLAGMACEFNAVRPLVSSTADLSFATEPVASLRNIVG